MGRKRNNGTTTFDYQWKSMWIVWQGQKKYSLLYSLCINFFHLPLLAWNTNIEKISIFSNKFFYNFRLSEIQFYLFRASGLARRLLWQLQCRYSVKIYNKWHSPNMLPTVVHGQAFCIITSQPLCVIWDTMDSSCWNSPGNCHPYPELKKKNQSDNAG